MNLWDYIPTIHESLNEILSSFGCSSVGEYFETHRVSSELLPGEQIAYYLGQLNLIYEIALRMEHDLTGDEEE